MTRYVRWILRGLVGVVLCLGVGNIARKVFEPLPGDGVRWNTTGAGLVAGSSSGAVVDGDVLLRIDGMVVRTAADLVALDRAAAIGSGRLYEVKRAGQWTELEVEVVAGRASRSYLLLALAGLVSLGVALRLLVGEEREGTASASATAIAFAAMALGSPVGWMDLGDAVALAVDLTGRLLLAPSLVQTALAAIGISVGGLGLFVYLPSFLVAVGEVSFLTFGSLWSLPTAHQVSALLDRATATVLVASIAASLVVLAGGRFVAQGGNRASAARLLKGVLWGIGPYCFLFALPASIGRYSPLLAELALVPTVLVPVALVRVFSGPVHGLAELARSGLVGATSVVAVAGLLLAGGAVATEVLAPLGVPPWLGYAVTAIALGAGLTDRARGALQGWIEAGLDRRGYEARRSLVQLGRELAIERSPAVLAQTLIERLRGAFGVADCALYGVETDGAGDDLGLLWSSGSAPPRLGLRELSAASEVSPVADLPQADASELARSGFDTCVSLRVGERRVGLLVTGRGPAGSLGRRDLRLLADLGGYIAIALDHARMHNELVASAAAIRELEQFRANVVECLPVGILIVDLDGVVLSANRSLSRLLGQQVIGRDLGRSDYTTVGELPAVVLDPPPPGSVAHRACEDRVLAVTSTLLRRAGGTIQGRIIVVEDATARVAEERERARREKLATVGMLAAGIAHEVNTPLTGIASYIQMLMATCSSDDPRRALLEKADRQAFRAAQMVRNFLDYARPGDGRVDVVDLNAIASSAVALLEHESRRAGTRVQVALDHGISRILGRDGELEQVALNVMKNALDALPRGGTLSVSTGQNGDEVFLRVKDDGVGIAPDAISRIFDPFFSTKRRGAGHGLGLHVAYGIVKGHGGDIRVASTPGQGATFEIALRAAAAKVANAGGT